MLNASFYEYTFLTLSVCGLLVRKLQLHMDVLKLRSWSLSKRVWGIMVLNAEL